MLGSTDSSEHANVSPLVTGLMKGENPVWHVRVFTFGSVTQSRVAWDGSPKLVVHSI